MYFFVVVDFFCFLFLFVFVILFLQQNDTGFLLLFFKIFIYLSCIASQFFSLHFFSSFPNLCSPSDRLLLLFYSKNQIKNIKEQ